MWVKQPIYASEGEGWRKAVKIHEEKRTEFQKSNRLHRCPETTQVNRKVTLTLVSLKVSVLLGESVTSLAHLWLPGHFYTWSTSSAVDRSGAILTIIKRVFIVKAVGKSKESFFET